MTSSLLVSLAFLVGVVACALVILIYTRASNPAGLHGQLVALRRDHDALLSELHEIGRFIQSDASRQGGVLRRIEADRLLALRIERDAPELFRNPDVLAELHANERYLTSLASHWFRDEPLHTQARWVLDQRISPFCYEQIAQRFGVDLPD